MTRTDPPYVADERTMLAAFVDLQRSTMRVKCEGISEQDVRRSVVSSSPRMTLAGVVSHLRWVEHYWFEHVLAGLAIAPPLTQEDPDADWCPQPGVTLTQLLDEYDEQCERSRRIASVLALDALAVMGERPVTLRWVLNHMIEETARHAGHVDIVRELLDGRIASRNKNPIRKVR